MVQAPMTFGVVSAILSEVAAKARKAPVAEPIRIAPTRDGLSLLAGPANVNLGEAGGVTIIGRGETAAWVFFDRYGPVLYMVNATATRAAVVSLFRDLMGI